MTPARCPRCRGPTISGHDPATGLRLTLDANPITPAAARTSPHGAWRRHPKRGWEHIVIPPDTGGHALHDLHECQRTTEPRRP